MRQFKNKEVYRTTWNPHCPNNLASQKTFLRAMYSLSLARVGWIGTYSHHHCHQPFVCIFYMSYSYHVIHKCQTDTKTIMSSLSRLWKVAAFSLIIHLIIKVNQKIWVALNLWDNMALYLHLEKDNTTHILNNSTINISSWRVLVNFLCCGRETLKHHFILLRLRRQQKQQLWCQPTVSMRMVSWLWQSLWLTE